MPSHFWLSSIFALKRITLPLTKLVKDISHGHFALLQVVLEALYADSFDFGTESGPLGTEITFNSGLTIRKRPIMLSWVFCVSLNFFYAQ